MSVKNVCALVLALLVIADCEQPEREPLCVQLKKGEKEFCEEISKMSSPKGVLHSGSGINEEGVLLRDDPDFHEHFVFDTQVALIVLSESPLYYARINSPEYCRSLEFELTQLALEKNAADKEASSVPWMRGDGGIHYSLCFVPNEFRYGKSGGLQDINYDTYEDPPALMERAGEILFYTPGFGEENLYEQMRTLKQRGVRVVQHIREQTFSGADNRRITWYDNPDLKPGFTVIAGRGLCELNEQSYGKDEWADTDFLFLTTVPLGNSCDKEKSYLSKTAAGRHGFALTIRGDISSYLDFFEREGISMNVIKPLPLSMEIKDKGACVKIDWFEKREIGLLLRNGLNAAAAREYCLNDSCFVVKNVVRDTELEVTLMTPDGEQLAHDAVYLSPLVISEIAYWGSSCCSQDGEANADDFLEIKNVSSRNVELSRFDIVAVNTGLTEKFWCGPSGADYSCGYSDTRAALEGILAPGECAVISTRINGNSSRFFHPHNYGIPPHLYERASMSELALSKGYTLQIQMKGQVLHEVHIDGDTGTKAPYRSMVRDTHGDFVSSGNDTDVPANADDHRKNYCSPGYSAAGEL